jgi:hypothetical protein
MVDLKFLNPQTIVGRSQIRQELENGFHIPTDIVTWFFDQFDEKEDQVRCLRQQLRCYEE